MRDNGTLYHLHGDHLGSTSLTTNTGGGIVAVNGYYPFGASRFTNGTRPTNKDFTGQLLDGTGLHFYNARYYDSIIGRFISADTIVPEPDGSQGFNRYTYVKNNPVRYTDPTGHVDCDDWDGCRSRRPYMFEGYTLILACGQGTNGACSNPTSLPSSERLKLLGETFDDTHRSIIPLAPIAEEFQRRGGEVLYLDADLFETGRYTDEGVVAAIDAAQQSDDIFLAGWSSGGTAVLKAAGARSNDKNIKGVAALDPYLNGNEGGNQDIADIAVQSFPVFIGHSNDNVDPINYPTLSPVNIGIPNFETLGTDYGGGHYDIAINLSVAYDVINFFAAHR